MIPRSTILLNQRLTIIRNITRILRPRIAIIINSFRQDIPRTRFKIPAFNQMNFQPSPMLFRGRPRPTLDKARILLKMRKTRSKVLNRSPMRINSRINRRLLTARLFMKHTRIPELVTSHKPFVDIKAIISLNQQLPHNTKQRKSRSRQRPSVHTIRDILSLHPSHPNR